MRSHEVRVLVVDDEPDIIEFLSYNLEREGFLIDTATNGLEAIAKAKKHMPHLILLDIMMPEMDGVTACYKIRKQKENKDTLIAFLTARHEEYSEIAGLDAGADDYIHKPVGPRVLTSRVKALLRRHKILNQEDDQVIRLGELFLDKEKYIVRVAEELIDLAKKEFEILWYMASKPGKVFSRTEIYRQVWGNDVIVGNRTIDVHISKLRNKLEQRYIRTIKGIGYKIELE